jgi:hypothetical protein
MGCDIHMYAEENYSEERWIVVEEPIFADPYYSPDREICRWNTPYTSQPYRGRNYDLFALLAGVRNYNKIRPISEPKGLPEDVSRIIKAYSDDWDVDGHSHSWLTLAELQAWDWASQNRMETWAEAVGSFFTETMPALAKLAKDPTNIRIVFWFDN